MRCLFRNLILCKLILKKNVDIRHRMHVAPSQRPNRNWGQKQLVSNILLNLLQKNVGACQISKYVVSTRFRSSIPERDLTRNSEFLFETTSPICLLTVSTQQNKGKGSWRPKKVGQHLRENRLAVFQFQQ